CQWSRLMRDSFLYTRSIRQCTLCSLFSFNDPAPTEIYTLSLHDALPILLAGTFTYTGEAETIALLASSSICFALVKLLHSSPERSEEHTSELQSRENLVCRLLLEKKKTQQRCLECHDLAPSRPAQTAVPA